MPPGVYKRKPKTPSQIAADDAKRGVPNSPKHNAAISVGLKNSDAVKAKADAQRGIPRTPKTCAAISAGTIGVPHTTTAQIAADKTRGEKMRGGNDICDHHYIYDHDDLSKYTIKMTRSDHQKLHLLLRRLGYKVPHINQ